MNDALLGKRLLILGAYQNELDIVLSAKEMGIKTIVTDNRENWSNIPTKLAADEAWNISWADLDSLEKKCIETNVCGCFAGFDEKRVALAKELCHRMGWPFYAENVDLDRITNKIRFKEACVVSGVTVPKSYEYGDEKEFPVILKPSDQGGSKGISIVYSSEDFEGAYQKALSASDNGQVLIEEYIVADELMAFFSVVNGEPTLSAMCDRYMHYFGNEITQLPNGYFYPSKHLGLMQQYNFDKYRKLIQNLGIKNGLIAFQAFARGTDIIPFDPTFRIDGTTSYHIVEAINGVNILKMMLSYSLTGKMCDESYFGKENPSFTKYAFQLPILLKKGVISRIEGIDEVRKMSEVIYVREIHFVGDEMKMRADFQQMLCRIHIIVSSLFDLKRIVESIYEKIHVFDDDGKEMVICQFDGFSSIDKGISVQQDS